MESAIAEAKLDQTDSELEIGSGNADDDIENRLLRLKGIDPSTYIWFYPLFDILL